MFAEVVVPLLIIAACTLACAAMFLAARRRRPAGPEPGRPAESPAVRTSDG